MIVVQETTEWADPIPNHIYFLSDNRTKMLAYVPWGTGELKVFSKPLGFSTTRRRFITVPNQWGWTPQPDTTVKTWTVQGSGSNTYTVTERGGQLTCSCPGHRFKGTCKHINQVLDK